MVDGVRRQDFDVQCGVAYLDDWQINKADLQGSCILNPVMYQSGWFHCENFMKRIRLTETPLVPDSNLIDGLDLSKDVKFGFYATCVSGTYMHYTWGITQKILSIIPGNITCI